MPISLNRRPPTRADFEREALPHLRSLHGAAVRLCGNPRDAEDLVQDTLVKAYRFFDSFEPGTNCRAWLFRIMTNHFRTRYREREREREIMTEAESSTANLERFVAGSSAVGDTEEALLGRMNSADVERALARLPEDYRTAVVLCDLEDFSYKEIAEMMGCPAGTVMSRLHRGRKMLQKLLFDRAVEEGIVRRDGGDAGGTEAVDLDAYRRSRAGGPS